jgi:hypothetical protein
MYELYCPFKTEMEKTIKINDLKESGKFDEQMEEKFRNQVGVRLIFFLIILLNLNNKMRFDTSIDFSDRDHSLIAQKRSV